MRLKLTQADRERFKKKYGGGIVDLSDQELKEAKAGNKKIMDPIRASVKYKEPEMVKQFFRLEIDIREKK